MTTPVSPQTDYMTDLAHGRFPGNSILQMFGHSPNTSGTPSSYTVWELAQAQTILTSAAALELLSSSASDTAAGTGATLIHVEGIDANYILQSENVIPNGTSVVALTKTYRHVNTVQVVGAGSNKRNVGNITIREAGAGSIQGYVIANAGTSRTAAHMVPKGYTLTLEHVITFANKSGSPTASVTLEGIIVFESGVLWSVLPITLQNGVPLSVDMSRAPFVVPEKSLLMFTITAASIAGLDVSTIASGLLTRNHT